MAYCKDCKQYFSEKGAWQTRCYDCYKVFKAKTESKVEYIKVPVEPKEYKEFKEKIKHIIALCHPDKHHNSEKSNEITKWLIGVYKK